MVLCGFRFAASESLKVGGKYTTQPKLSEDLRPGIAYRTRDGRKALVQSMRYGRYTGLLFDSVAVGMIAGETKLCYWRACVPRAGRRGTRDKNSMDLVALWYDKGSLNYFRWSRHNGSKTCRKLASRYLV